MNGLGVSHTTHLLLLVRDRRHELVQQHGHHNIQQCDWGMGPTSGRSNQEQGWRGQLHLYPFTTPLSLPLAFRQIRKVSTPRPGGETPRLTGGSDLDLQFI